MTKKKAAAPMTSIRIGYNPDFAPFAALKDGQAVGSVIERLVPALEAAGLEATFVPVPLPEMKARLLAGDVDALAGVGMAGERQDIFAFSKPLVVTGGAWIAAADSGWPGDDDLRAAAPGRWRVVTPALGPLVAPIRERFPDLDLTVCEDYPSALQAVLDGHADAAALNLHVGCLMAQRDHPGQFRMPETPFVTLPLGLAVPSGDPAGLLPRIDAHLV